MAFDEIAQVGIVEYVERHRVSNAVWGFIHIPKTAGTSLIQVLAQDGRPYYRISPRSFEADQKKFEAMEWEAVEKFVELQRFRTGRHAFRSFSGHIRRQHADFIRAECPGVRFFTTLRNPVERVISAYQYCLTPAHPLHQEFARRYPTILDYALQPGMDNTMARYLLPDQEIAAQDAIATITKYFDFIGLQDMYDMSATAVFRMMGLNGTTGQRLNVTKYTGRNVVDAHAIWHIQQVNQLDEAIYRHVRTVLLSQRTEWFKHFGALRAA